LCAARIDRPAHQNGAVETSQRKIHQMNHNRNNVNIGAILQGLGAALQHGNGTPARGSRPPRTFSAPPPPPPRRVATLPKWMGGLNVLCSDAKHFAPMPMTFVRFTTSERGHPIAHYKCACQRSKFFALNPEGKAFLLFEK
jgi:hypothetical protein